MFTDRSWHINRALTLSASYGLTVLLVAASAAAHLGLKHFVGPLPTFITFYPTLIVVALLFGLGPGLAATVLGGLTADYLILPPVGSLKIENTADQVALAVFLLIGAAICVTTSRAQASRSERVSRESRVKLETALSAMTDAVFISDTEGRFIDFNDAFATFHKFRNKDECAKTFAEYPGILDMFLPDGRPAPVDMWAVPRALRGETATNAEYGLRRKDTGESWVGSYSFSPIRDKDGQVVGSVVVGRDVTEHKRAEQELQKAHDELEERVRERTEDLRRQADLLELAYEAILVRDPGNRITFWNARAEDLYGWTKAEALGAITHDLFKTRFPVPFDEYTASLMEEGHWMGELVHVRKDGSPITVHSRQALQRDEAGDPVAVMEINLDITERKAADEEIKRYASQLELSNRELQDFAFVASHDLQEPLRKIQAFGDQLKIGYSEVLGEEGLDYLGRMQNAAVRMQELIRALLNYSRVTTKALPFSMTDLRTVAVEVASDLETLINGTGGRVEVGDLPAIEADPVQMRQLLQNLVGNALKFRGDDKPVVKVYSRRVQYGRSNGKYEIFVEDNGIGFDEKYLDRIFVPFQRLHGRGVYEGTGIGLAICKKIADRHGGSITARSAPGKGSTFIVTLSAKQTEGEGE